ncbi:MAG: type I methionyl aminopeptidase [Patescibacteria group bacterium]
MSVDRITAMRKGGAVLGTIRDRLVSSVAVGHSFAQIEENAQALLAEHQVKPSFSTVPGYNWATCIMKNDGLCHGIPDKQKVVAGDCITIDIGLIYEGYHLDTSISFLVESNDSQLVKFLDVGKASLAAALAEVQAGARVFDVSRAMQRVVEKAGYSAVRELTGHGVGAQLHMPPNIPCVAIQADKRVQLEEDQTIAVEIMYAAGSAVLQLDDDGWTYRSRDRSLTGMFEDTVLVTATGCEVLTKPSTSGIIDLYG